MARIRTVKPELFKHEELFDLELKTGLPLRVAFIGIFAVCDREGRFKWRPRAIKTEIMPYDQIEFSDILAALHVAGFIEKYAVDGQEYGVIPTFLKHQSINQREAQSSLPPPENVMDRTHVQAHASTSEKKQYEYRGVNVAPALRETIIARDGGKCLRCGATHDLTVDHIFPQSIGGTHAPSNLRCLCRSCNSARPVAGQALINDLAKDGLTLNDMSSLCTHMHARGEGKGREEEGKGTGREQGCDGASPPPAAGLSAVRPKTAKEPAPSSAIWEAYASAYHHRYSADPVRNAKVNGQLAHLLARLGAEEAPAVAAFFVGHNNRYYVQKMHAVDCLLADAEKLRTEWATGRRVTAAAAQEADRLQDTGDMWGRIMDQQETIGG